MDVVVFGLLKNKSRMIIIKVQGGLGNQLLQYSIGRVLTMKYGKEIKYDLSFFELDTKYTKRPYLLDKFMVTITVATNEEIKKVRYPFGFVSKIFALIRRVLNKSFFKKYYIGYDKNFFTYVSNNKNLYLEGFWQCYRYYEESLPALSKEISLKDMSTIDAFKAEVFFLESNSVSVHIRRGDFLNKNAGTRVVEKDYYETAVPLLEERIKDPTYYIFSDDIEWVKREMGHLFKKAVYVSSYGFLDCEEFSLIKDCKHSILSNSTFCWMATLLTNYSEKVVIYPKDWKNVYLNKDTDIVCPPSWIGI